MELEREKEVHRNQASPKVLQWRSTGFVGDSSSQGIEKAKQALRCVKEANEQGLRGIYRQGSARVKHPGSPWWTKVHSRV